LYESLLDHDLEDETTVVADVATDIDDKALDDDDETDGLVEAEDAAERMAKMSNRKVCSKGAKANRGRMTRCGCISRRWGEIPLLTRKEEIRLARKIEINPGCVSAQAALLRLCDSQRR